ncbi:MAG: two pore domain potassium channel family protein [Chloroflexi bacterium]|nr:two pore domain potassium channel family protein [Chloroflexota bacterium]
MLAFLLVFVTFWRAIRRSSIDPEFRALVLVLLSTLTLGTTFYHHIEGWDWLDSLYFCVVTLATIGYGDLAPKTPQGRAFTIFFVFLGIGLLAAFFSKLASSIVAGSAWKQPQRPQQQHASPEPAPDEPPATD